MISRPQKAPSKSITDEELELLAYPVLGSVKLDGYRCVTGNTAYTSSMKLIQNKFIQSILSRPEYAGLDGEIIVGKANDPNAFNNTTGPVRRVDGEPDFRFYVFDRHDIRLPYASRLVTLAGDNFIEIIDQILLNSPQEVIDYTNWCCEQGYEGAMIRIPGAPYKEGRCTFKDMNIFKRKPLEDDECVIVGFEEQMENLNEKTVNELGLSTRSTNKENMVGKDTLGAFKVICKNFAVPFSIGTGVGLTEKMRKNIWACKELYLNRFITFKYQKHGSIDAPRQPIFKGFRDKSDMTEY